MTLQIRLCATLILLALVFSLSTAVTAAMAAPRGNLMIFYSSDVAGETEPCG